ncbi:argininosuccinate lyase [Candidatus Uabimicrobium sp. HlEnr_7]|uniref:argininosuccinate lyase n=1 Tax=Candidatus Uabimicrobium helgolandensis TaxID=3095367 RepID=UPI003555D6A5
MTDIRGEGDRIKVPPSEELIDSAYAFELKDANYLYDGMSYADLAHVVVLIEEKIIDADVGKILLGGLQKLHNNMPEDFSPRFGDTYTNREVVLKKIIGENAGWLHVGRARRECSTIGYILNMREKLLIFAEEIANVAKAFLKQVKCHHDTIMPDFTYLQHAQPTNLSHYLLTFLYPVVRDFSRIKEHFGRLNQSPAGSGSVNGTKIPLDRHRLSELLGFDGLTRHTRDAMWRPDIAYELHSLLVTSFLNLNRFVEELQIWNSKEFSMVELADEHCRTSVIMPQKKNPYGLAYIRGLTGWLVGETSSLGAALKGTSGQPDNRIFAYGKTPESYDSGIKALRLLAKIIDSFTVNTDLLAKRVENSFSFATDLAEFLMLEENISYTKAHRAVGVIVRRAIERNETSFKLATIHEVLKEQEIEPKISSDDLQKLLDPTLLIKERKTPGGASDIKNMTEEIEQETRLFCSWRQQKKQNIQTSFDDLEKQVNTYTK